MALECERKIQVTLLLGSCSRICGGGDTGAYSRKDSRMGLVSWQPHLGFGVQVASKPLFRLWAGESGHAGLVKQEGSPKCAYLWLCDLPPWGTFPLPTTFASESPGGCSPVAGEWPGRTHPGTLSLQGQREARAGCQCPTRHTELPVPAYILVFLFT